MGQCATSTGKVAHPTRYMCGREDSVADLAMARAKSNFMDSTRSISPLQEISIDEAVEMLTTHGRKCVSGLFVCGLSARTHTCNSSLKSNYLYVSTGFACDHAFEMVEETLMMDVTRRKGTQTERRELMLTIQQYKILYQQDAQSVDYTRGTRARVPVDVGASVGDLFPSSICSAAGELEFS